MDSNTRKSYKKTGRGHEHEQQGYELEHAEQVAHSGQHTTHEPPATFVSELPGDTPINGLRYGDDPIEVDDGPDFGYAYIYKDSSSTAAKAVCAQVIEEQRAFTLRESGREDERARIQEGQRARENEKHSKASSVAVEQASTSPPPVRDAYEDDRDKGKGRDRAKRSGGGGVEDLRVAEVGNTGRTFLGAGFAYLTSRPSKHTTPEQESENYRSKFDEMRAKHEELRSKYKILRSDYNDLCGELQATENAKVDFRKRYLHAQKAYDEADRRAQNLQRDNVMATEANLKERDLLKNRIDELYASHIRSVNNVGTGLDPISDDAIGRRFADLSDEINSWCRKAFRGKAQTVKLAELGPEAREFGFEQTLGERVKETDTVGYSHLMEAITWCYIESAIFSAWFPGMVPQYLEPITALDSWVTAGDKSVNHERKEFWRAYTCSLLFQNPEVQTSLGYVEVFRQMVVRLYGFVQREKKVLSDDHFRALDDRMRKAMKLAAELRCQRGAYEIDHNIAVGEPFNEATMDNIKFDDDDHEQPVIACILSKGWLRLPYAGALRIDARVSKARVLVREAEK